MRVVVTQPHFFPWVGYFDKMAKADQFILLDEVQLEKASQMLRNRIISTNGKTNYITISADKTNHYDKKYNEIRTVDNDVWKQRHLSLLSEYYKKAPYFHEIMPRVRSFYDADYATVCEWTVASIVFGKELLGISTPLRLQSEIEYDRSNKRSDLILAICLAVHSDQYYCGRGASVNYLDREKFTENNIKIYFQEFKHPVYPQINTAEFIPGISVLDMLYNCGIEETRRIFWDNVHSTHEFDEIDE